MFAVAALIAFILAIFLYLFRFGHGTITWILFALTGAACLAAAKVWGR